jgi:hypothetical protein
MTQKIIYVSINLSELNSIKGKISVVTASVCNDIQKTSSGVRYEALI